MLPELPQAYLQSLNIIGESRWVKPAAIPSCTCNRSSMKLIVQIALGVFMGSVTAQVTMDKWHKYQEQNGKEQALNQEFENEKARLEQADRIRAMFLEHRKNKNSGNNKPPAAFVPDDAQIEPAPDE